MKKYVMLSVSLIVFLVICWGIGRAWHRVDLTDSPDTTPTSESVTADNRDEQTDDNADAILLKSAIFENAVEISDNPWGVTAGVIETDEEGKCIFLTPNTAVSFSDIGLDEVAFAYRIHPWVQADSDGAGLDVMLYRKDGEELFREEIAVEADNAWMEYELDLRDYADIGELRVSCNNGGHNDDVCDWVVIKYVDNLHP